MCGLLRRLRDHTKSRPGAGSTAIDCRQVIGRQLGHFRILEEIGAGGMGIVYRALDVGLDRPVALKVLPPEALADGDRRKRFLREAQAASALNHPNIVTIFEIGAQDGVDFIAMELVEGHSLPAVVPPNGLPVGRAVAYAVQIAAALAFAHERGVIHRDLKTANIRLTPDGRVKVLDFGLAKLVRTAPAGEQTPAHLLPTDPATAFGMVLGTPQYMSPEQAQGKEVDARSDLFSFGCVLYELLTGRNPFAGENPTQTLSAILRDQPPPLATRRAEVPAELERIVAKTLEKDPEYRYQHAAEMLADLKMLERDSTAVTGRTTARLRRGRLAPGLAWPLAAIVLVALWGLWGWRREIGAAGSGAGAVWTASSLLAGSGDPPTYRTVFGTADFHTVRGDGDWRYYSIGQVYHVAGADDFWAPVHLPDGARILDVCFHIFDSRPEDDVTITLTSIILYAGDQPPGRRPIVDAISRSVKGQALLCAKPVDPVVKNVADVDGDGRLENLNYYLLVGLPATDDSQRFAGAYIDWKPPVTR